MNITLLSNETVPNTWKNIEKKLDKPGIAMVRIAVSYLMKSGADLVKRRLSNLISRGIPIEIVFGDDMGISDSQALTILSDINCSLRVYRGRKKRSYHPKMWIIDY